MTLSEDEQNSLDRIENSLQADDPQFAINLDVDAVKDSLLRRRRLADYGFWIGLATMMGGAACAQGVLSIGAMISCYGFALLTWATLTLVRWHRANPTGGNQEMTT